MSKPALAGSVQLAALAWTVALLIDSAPLDSIPALLVGFALLSMSTVAMVGMVVVGGRWAHRLGLATLALTLALAIVRPVDAAWAVALVASGGAAIALMSPAVTKSIRRLPSASGPPPRAVAPALVLLATPGLLGLLGNDATPWALLVVGLSAPVAAFAYTRVLPGGLIAVRLVWPLLALGLSPILGAGAGIAAAVVAIGVAFIAWDRSVKASYHPPQEVGTTFPIPPELAPGEILDAADVDDRGRPR